MAIWQVRNPVSAGTIVVVGATPAKECGECANDHKRGRAPVVPAVPSAPTDTAAPRHTPAGPGSWDRRRWKAPKRRDHGSGTAGWVNVGARGAGWAWLGPVELVDRSVVCRYGCWRG